MEIAVCDDSSEDQKKLVTYLSQYAEKQMFDIKINSFDNGEDLISAFQKYAYKIIFLDIYMDGLTGIDTAFKIRESDENCMIIFTTTSPDFRAEGFEVGAVHYLLKPLTYSGVETALNRCVKYFADSAKCINITVDRHLTKIPLKDILYAEVYGKTVLIHTVHKTFKTYTPLAEISKSLGGIPFLWCHRSFIVNMTFITNVLDSDFELTNGEKVPIHKNGRQKVKDEYSSYFFSSLRGQQDA